MPPAVGGRSSMSLVRRPLLAQEERGAFIARISADFPARSAAVRQAHSKTE
jgi:hypothetical protein